MPDIDFQKIVLNLIPKKGDEPVVFYASQYETKRPFIADLFWGDTEFAPGDDYRAEIDIRKNDDNLVVITDDVSIDNNEVSVILPVQAVTCIGKNLGQVKIYAADDQLIAALNFILEVQADPLAGGVTSETAIDNLTQQIEDIAQEVIGDDYYNKTEVDTLLNAKADKTDTYTKAQVDSALSAKANTADLATVATTGDYDDLLNKPVLPDMTQYYTKAEVDTLIDNIYPTLTASGNIATFKTALNKPLVSVTADPLATTITRCGKNLLDDSIRNFNGGTISFSATTYGKTLYLQAGTYTFSVTTADGLVTNLYAKNLDTNINIFVEYNILSKTFTIPSGCNVALYVYKGTYTSVSDIVNAQLELGSTATAYEAYNGITVPVADATTITTLTGVNNVFADAGSVTVQYKYMSI